MNFPSIFTSFPRRVVDAVVRFRFASVQTFASGLLSRHLNRVLQVGTSNAEIVPVDNVGRRFLIQLYLTHDKEWWLPL